MICDSIDVILVLIWYTVSLDLMHLNFKINVRFDRRLICNWYDVIYTFDGLKLHLNLKMKFSGELYSWISIMFFVNVINENNVVNIHINLDIYILNDIIKLTSITSIKKFTMISIYGALYFEYSI